MSETPWVWGPYHMGYLARVPGTTTISVKPAATRYWYYQ